MQSYDAIIVGAGQAGPPLADKLTQAGWTVCLVERKRFGGTCVNTGCMPTKTLVASAYAAHLAWQVRSLKPENGALALKLFKSNREAGLLLLFAIAAGSLGVVS